MPIELVAEISGNHEGKLINALDLISACQNNGATAIKFQRFEAERLCNRRGLKGDARRVYHEIYTPVEWLPTLISQCTIPWYSSIFDPQDVELLEGMNCPRYKIAAFEFGDRELFDAVMQTGKPLVFSFNRGATEKQWDVVHDLAAAHHYYDKITVLYATPYGGPAEEAQMWRMRDNVHAFLPSGLSDHTRSDANGWDLCAIIAATQGATMIERHVMISGTKPPDHAFSLTPMQLQALSERLATVESALARTA